MLPGAALAPCPGSTRFPGRCGAAPAFLAGSGHPAASTKQNLLRDARAQLGAEEQIQPLGVFYSEGCDGAAELGCL